ncbi:MAG TPA: hypothetical protein VJ755_13245 [Gemmatimonadales bacterium]|nr:hypothetical protein [Gemmatimonadales bacterium]
MQKALRIAAGLTGGLAILSTACESSTAAPFSQVARRDIDVDECAFGQAFTIEAAQLQNEFFPIHPGRQWQLEGEQGGELMQLTVTVLNATELVGGVTTRVVEERESVNGELVEVSRNFYAENRAGTVCYFGEDVTIFLPDGSTSTEGAWRADDASDPDNPSFPGVIMPANPRVGMRFQMEGAPGVAEDEGRIVESDRVKVPAGIYRETLRVREFNPLDGDIGFKTFAEDVGMIIDGEVKLTSCTVGCPADRTDGGREGREGREGRDH